MKRKTILRLISPLVVATFTLLPFASKVSATTPNVQLFDEFNSLSIRSQDPTAYWWVANSGENNGQSYVWEDYCGHGSCVQPSSSNGVNYVDLSLTTDTVSGFYTNADLSEQHSGWEYGTPGRWLPTSGKPVTIEARVKWTGGFTQDGSGNAVGTSGIWLWNTPIDYPNNTFHSVTSMGFSWQADESLYGKGLAAMVIRENIPVSIRKPLFNVDMNDWITLKMKWERNLLGTQTVHFWINGNYIGSEWIQIPINSGLSLEIWHDNQTYTLFNGTLLRTPVEDQHFLVDYVKVTQ